MEPGQARSAGGTFHALLDGLAAEHAKLLGENEDLRAQVRLAGGSPRCGSLRGAASADGGDAGLAHPFGIPASPDAEPEFPPRPGGDPPPWPAAASTGSKRSSGSKCRPRPPKELWTRVRDEVFSGNVTREKLEPTVVKREGAFEDLELSSVWKTEAVKRRHSKHTAVSLQLPIEPSSDEDRPHRTTSTFQRSSRQVWMEQEEARQRRMKDLVRRCILKPDDRRHLTWDLMSLGFLSYDVLGTPLEIFEPPDSTFRKVMEMTTLIFWTLDILVTFFCGYHTVKTIEMRPSKIALHYLKTWFVVDFAIVMLEWLSVGGAGILRAGKVIRGARIIRMLRIIKVQVLFEQLHDFIRSETSMMVFQIGRLVVFILVINHFVACGWWAVGTLVEDVDVRWTDRVKLADEGFAYSYLTSLHWALTQFTPASMEVVPTNKWERAYTILVLMLGLGAFSSFLASISSLMTQLRQLKTLQHKEDMLIRRYLMEHGVSFELGNHIMFFFRENRRFVKRKRLVEEDVKALTQLPESLRIKLHWEVYEPAITPHPLFFDLNMRDHSGLVEICHRSMNESMLGQGHELFHFGKVAERMYFVSKGTMSYQPGRGLQDFLSPTSSMTRPFTSQDGDDSIEVGTGRWISEMVLWMNWIHRGTVMAVGTTELVELEAKKFHEHARHRFACFNHCRHYARLYVQRIAEKCKDKEELPEDTWGNVDELQMIVHETSERLDRDTKKSMTGVLDLLLGVFAKQDGSAPTLRHAMSRSSIRMPALPET
mmetsp:Transcript_61069/g.189172  ORF Transcript_61069/g.189172 Transcript_61069/m.189172 type:complete len:766 (-) Transcript_61069:51-2348(-)